MKKIGYRNMFWLLPILIAAAALMMGQRRNHKDPSPADPGMRLFTPSAHGPYGPIPENPDVHDPNQGDEPDDPLDDEPDDSTDIPTQPQDKPLKITDIEVTLVDAGSDVGHLGDWMVVLHGQGFLEAERSPVVHIGDQVRLEEVYVNNAEGELYAILPAAVALGLKTQEFVHLSVQNPGGINLDPNRWVRFPYTKVEFLKSCQYATSKRYKREGYCIKKQ